MVIRIRKASQVNLLNSHNKYITAKEGELWKGKENNEVLLSQNFSYVLTYIDTEEIIATENVLEVQSTVNMTLKISCNGIELPTDDIEIANLSLALVYNQAI